MRLVHGTAATSATRLARVLTTLSYRTLYTAHKHATIAAVYVPCHHDRQYDRLVKSISVSSIRDGRRILKLGRAVESMTPDDRGVSKVKDQ